MVSVAYELITINPCMCLCLLFKRDRLILKNAYHKLMSGHEHGRAWGAIIHTKMQFSKCIRRAYYLLSNSELHNKSQIFCNLNKWYLFHKGYQTI